MQERQLLEVDPLFNERFFEIPQQTYTLDDLKHLVTFPLPSSAREFNAFQFSQDGVNFRLGFCDLLKNLYDFLEINDPVISATLSAFVKQYINNDGKDLGFTEICMPLYQQGVLYLAGILQLVKNDDIPLAIRKTGVKNLFSQLNVCSPGIYTHISDTYLRLASFLEVKNYFMSYRTEMAKQLISEKILKLRPNIYAGNDIHYSNAVINLYDDALGLQRIEDLLVRGCCDEVALEKLAGLFSADIGKHITVDNLFDQVINELNLEEWVAELIKFLSSNNLNAYNDSIKLLGDKLLRFGPGDLEVDRLLVTDEMAEIKGLSISAEYALYVNLFERMVASQYLTASSVELLGEKDDIRVYWLPLRTLKFAYVETKIGKQPFLPFFVNTLMNESSEMNVLDEIIVDHPEMYHEVVDYIIRYLNSADVPLDQQHSDGIANVLLYLAACYPNQWSLIINRLLPVYKPAFLVDLLADVTNLELAKETREFYIRNNNVHGDLLIDALLGSVHDLSALNVKGTAVIHVAARDNCLHIVKELLRLQVDVNLPDSAGATPLMHACFKSSAPLVDLLLERGANLNLTTRSGETAMHIAAWYGHAEMVIKLLQKAANPNFRNSNGMTPLHCACVSGNIDAINALLASGAQIEARTLDGASPLQIAVVKGHKEAALALLRAGAFPDLPKAQSTELLKTLMTNNDHRAVESVLKRMLVRYMSEISERKSRQSVMNGASLDEVRLNELESREKKAIHASKIYASSLLFSVLNAEGSDTGKIERFRLFKNDVAVAARHSKRFHLFLNAFRSLAPVEDAIDELQPVMKNKL